MGYQSLYLNTTNVLSIGAITAGSGYTPGTYTSVLTSASSGATFQTYPTVTVVVNADGTIHAGGVTLITSGVGASLSSATSLTVVNTLLGGTGTGFKFVVNLIGGSNNLAIGFQAGYGQSPYTNGNTVGSNNTYLGYQTVGSANNNTNEMVIGYQTIGLGSNTTAIGNSSTTLTKVFGAIQATTYTVATLPSASTSGVGARSFVTDALAPVFGATVTGSGAVATPVYSDGTNWKVG